jgi:hypothetical protein
MDDLIQHEKANPELENTLNIDEILEAAEHVDRDYIENCSLKTISQEVVDCLQNEDIQADMIHKYCQSLLQYKYIDFVHHIHKGKHIRWIRNGKLTNGGIIVDIKFLENGTHILCKNHNRFIQYKFDDCISFQKLTPQELLILQIKDHL